MENPRQFSSTDLSDPWITSPTNTPTAKPIASPPTSETRPPGFLTAMKSVQQWQQTRSEIDPIEMQAYREAARRQLEGLPVASTPSSAAENQSQLTQIQRSTPERQSLPSTGRPPPTPNGTSARASALVEPTATPAPAALKEAIGNAVGGIGQTLPRSLPQAAGRLIIPGVGAGLTFAGALIAGQSVTQAAATTAIATGASVVGGLIGTAVAGPIGFYVGSMVGGFVGSYLANSLLPTQLPTSAAHLESARPNYPPINQGQTAGVLYRVSFAWEQFFNGNSQGTQYLEVVVRAPIKAIALGVPPGLGSVGGYVIGTNPDGSDDVKSNSLGYYPASEAKGMQFLSVSRVDGKSDITPGVVQLMPPIDNMPYYMQPSPLGSDATIPAGTPQAGLNKGKNRDVAPSMPSNNLPNGGGAFPGHGGLAPSYLPNPTQTPSNGGGMLPDYAPQPQPMPFLEPQDTPVAREVSRNGVTVTQSTGGIAPITYADVTPATITQSTVTRSEGTDALGNYIPPGTQAPASSFALPTSTPQPKKSTPTPDALSPVPKRQLQPINKTTEQATTDKTSELIKQQKKDFDDQIGRLTAIATAIAALTPAILGIPDAIAKSPTVQAANKETTQGAVCEIAQPGGCLGAPIKQAENAAKANSAKIDGINDKLNALGAAGQVVDLGLLTIINNKLGDQVPGGISKFMENIAKNTYVEKALAVLTFATTLHNALMLSNNLAQTLGSIINTVLGLILPKGLDGTPLDIGAVLGKTTEFLIKEAVGEANYTKLTQEWTMANRIYQATTNVFNALTNATSTLVNALEVIGSQNAKIGNALKKWGAVGERAYEWFHPNPNFHNKYFTFLNNAETTANTIQAVVQVPVSIVEARNEINSANEEFKAAIKGDRNPDGTPKEGGIATQENKDVKDEFDLSKLISKGIELIETNLEADE